MSKERITLALDVDNVLGNLAGSWAEMSNLLLKTNKTARDYNELSWAEYWGVDPDTAKQLYEIINIVNFPTWLPLIKGAQQGVQELAKHCDLVVATSLPESMMESRLYWLEKYFPDAFRNVYSTDPKGEGTTKGEFLLGKGVGYLLDDQLRHVKDMVSRGGVGILFGNDVSCGWQTDYDTALGSLGVRRALNWPGAVDCIITAFVRGEEDPRQLVYGQPDNLFDLAA
jgi:hypothetical protein